MKYMKFQNPPLCRTCSNKLIDDSIWQKYINGETDLKDKKFFNNFYSKLKKRISNDIKIEK
jgi:hypothetical protein